MIDRRNRAEGDDSNNEFFHTAVTFGSSFTSSPLFLNQRMIEGKPIDTACRQSAVFVILNLPSEGSKPCRTHDFGL